MIKRYTRPEMERIWELTNRYAKWLQVEILACEAMAKEGLIPKEALDKAAQEINAILKEKQAKGLKMKDLAGILSNVPIFL